MPNRTLKDSICTSENLDSLSPFAECMFFRLIVNCDDFGRFEARPAVLKGKLYPLKDYNYDQIMSWLQELCNADLLFLYESDGKPFLQMKKWSKHQRQRAKYSKYPSPDDGTCQRLTADDSTCQQAPADAANCRHLPSEYDNDIRITSNESSSTYSLTGISSSPSKEVDEDSKDTQNVSCIKDGMTKFTAQLEKPSTAAAYLMDMGIDIGDYFIAQQYHGFIEDGMEEDAIMYAAFLAKSGNKASWAYVRKILNNWLTNGITTKAQAEEEHEKRSKAASSSSRSSKSHYNPDGTYDYQSGLDDEWESL